MAYFCYKIAISFKGTVSSGIELITGLYGWYKHHWQVFDFHRIRSLISTSIPQKDIIFFMQAMIWASGSFNGTCSDPPPSLDPALFPFVFVLCQPLFVFTRKEAPLLLNLIVKTQLHVI